MTELTNPYQPLVSLVFFFAMQIFSSRGPSIVRVLNIVTFMQRARNKRNFIFFIPHGPADCYSVKRSIRKHHSNFRFTPSCQLRNLIRDIHSVLESIPIERGHELLMYKM